VDRAGVTQRLDPEMLLRAYSLGVFPMADHRDADDVFWVEPRQRGVLPLDGFHLPRSLAKVLRAERFGITADRAFDRVMAACAEARADRPETWINPTIITAYQALFARGNAHSIECWDGTELAGGLYGVKLGAAFFGESMFTRVTDASKCALAALVARLRVGGFRLLDTQFLTDHLARFGAVEVPRARYKGLLAAALGASGDFAAFDWEAADRPSTTVSGPVSGKRIVQLLTQTS
jgi:leucyl/phenylalanyl-tRNA--protein transferase